jgi:hypothetical protein
MSSCRAVGAREAKLEAFQHSFARPAKCQAWPSVVACGRDCTWLMSPCIVLVMACSSIGPVYTFGPALCLSQSWELTDPLSTSPLGAGI